MGDGKPFRDERLSKFLANSFVPVRGGEEEEGMEKGKTTRGDGEIWGDGSSLPLLSERGLFSEDEGREGVLRGGEDFGMTALGVDLGVMTLVIC